MVSSQRIHYLDRLRVFGAYAVILVHVAAEFIFTVDVGSDAWEAMNIVDGLSRWCVPIFVMISGALFLNKNPQGEDRTKDYRKIWKKNILHLITSFFFWSIVYCLTDYYRLENMDHVWAHRVSEILFGPPPFWFLYMMFGLYILLPFLRPIAHDQKLLNGFIVFSAIFTFLLPSLQLITTDLAGENPFLSQAVSTVFSGIGNITWHFTLGYTSYFLIGYALESKEISKRQQWIIYLLGLFGWIAVPVLTSYFSNIAGGIVTHYYGYFFLPTMLAAIALFVFGKYHWNRPSRLWRFLSDHTFGVYLVHHLVLFELRHHFANPFPGIHTIGGLLLAAGTVFGISLLISIVIRHIPILKRWVI